MKRLILALLAFPFAAHAQYPDRPVTLLIGFPAGGMVDLVARALAEGSKERFPKGIVVVVKAGAGGAIAAGETARAAPDGYTVNLSPLSALVVQPQIHKLAFRTPDDYAPVINVVSFHSMLVVRQDAPWRTPHDVLRDAKARPGAIRVGTPGEATSPHMALEELKRLAGVDLLHVPYKGWGESSGALLGGHIDMLIGQPGEIKPMVEGRRMHAVANFQATRSPTFPDVPTFAELGFHAVAPTSFSVIAPKGTPPEVLRYLHDGFKAGMERPAFSELMKQRAVEVDYKSSDQLKAYLAEQYRAHAEILKRLGMLKE